MGFKSISLEQVGIEISNCYWNEPVIGNELYSLSELQAI